MASSLFGFLDSVSQPVVRVELRGQGVCIGRDGGDDVRSWASQHQLTYVPISHLDSLFNDMPKGEISAKHCLVTIDQGCVYLVRPEECRNGVFHNESHEPLPKGGKAQLIDGDKIFLIKSLTPVPRKVAFVFHRCTVEPPVGSVSVMPCDADAGPARRLCTEPAQTNHNCGLCFEPLDSAVILDPCGHSFNARCIVRCYLTQLRDRLPLACPLCRRRSVTVDVNHELRDLVAATRRKLCRERTVSSDQEGDETEPNRQQQAFEPAHSSLEDFPPCLDEMLPLCCLCVSASTMHGWFSLKRLQCTHGSDGFEPPVQPPVQPPAVQLAFQRWDSEGRETASGLYF